ncbi:unnamed protein product [Owenia fusiformis]|uniref:INTS8 TPR repeats domain-containing protein n=1 Tax=Owenia fusiformis TaxID=6347 RepID=A0A8J1TDY6_OWEFU|nr:unnamed protein product [Owenia fusiformis]
MAEMEQENALDDSQLVNKPMWFEFVLNEELLEQHLAQNPPDPSATALIQQFLNQAEISQKLAKDDKEGAAKQQGQDNNTVENEDGGDVEKRLRRIHTLKLLAMKSAAYLKWDLSILQDKLPLMVVQAVLLELLCCTLNDDWEVTKHTTLDYTSIPDEAWFALQLYHRCCVQCVIQESFPHRQTQSANIVLPGQPAVLPGQPDPATQLQEANSHVLIQIKEQLSISGQVLNMCLHNCRHLRVPTLQCFGAMSDSGSLFQWEKGDVLSKDQVQCQLLYDLGCLRFYEQNYTEAHELFTETKTLLDKISECPSSTGWEGQIERSRLEGYCTACHALNNMQAPEVKAKSSILEQIQQCKRLRTNDALVDLLLKDNETRELSRSYRQTLQDDLIYDRDVYISLYTCNTVHRLLDAEPQVCTHYMAMIHDFTSQQLAFLFKALDRAGRMATKDQKHHIRNFLRSVLSRLSVQTSEILPLLTQNNLMQYIENSDSLQILLAAESRPCFKPDTSLNHWETHSNEPGVLEKALLLSYDPAEIKAILQQLHPKLGWAVKGLNEKWKLHRELQAIFDSFPQGLNQSWCFIVVAKARQALQMKLYSKAKELLLTAEKTIKEFSYKLVKLIRWEVLLADLLYYQRHGTVMEGVAKPELLKKAKACVTAYRLESDIKPGLETMTYSLAFLLCVEEWEYICHATNTTNEYIQFARAVAETCKELPDIQNARKPSRNLWDTVVQLYSGTGGQKSMEQLSQHSFLTFALKIQGSLCLRVLLSCVTKLYSIVKDTTCEISCEYISLWPTALPTSGGINQSALGDGVWRLMDHSIETSPNNAQLLRTKADIHYACQQYMAAVQSYLEAGAVSSHYFSQPVPLNIYNDALYRRLIKCCSNLNNHTQVIVLCQLLDDVDYSLAFKSAQEKGTCDAMDTYYDFIWDITILEYLANLHHNRGEEDKQQIALKAISCYELNSSNTEEILHQAVEKRKLKFLRTLANQYCRDNSS